MAEILLEKLFSNTIQRNTWVRKLNYNRRPVTIKVGRGRVSHNVVYCKSDSNQSFIYTAVRPELAVNENLTAVANCSTGPIKPRVL